MDLQISLFITYITDITDSGIAIFRNQLGSLVVRAFALCSGGPVSHIKSIYHIKSIRILIIWLISHIKCIPPPHIKRIRDTFYMIY